MHIEVVRHLFKSFGKMTVSSTDIFVANLLITYLH